MNISYMLNLGQKKYLGHVSTDEWRFEVFVVALFKIFNRKYS